MIFVTVGTQLGFDRMVRTVDEWAARASRRDVFAQIGPADYRPRHIDFKESITPREFRERVESASVVVAHAGMGSIISALELQRPIVVMPRHAARLEQRNDHQIATARELGALGLVNVARDEAELANFLDRLAELRPGRPLGPSASPELIDFLKNAIHAP